MKAWQRAVVFAPIGSAVLFTALPPVTRRTPFHRAMLGTVVTLVRCMVRSHRLGNPTIAAVIASLLWILFPAAVHAQVAQPGDTCFIRPPAEGRTVKGTILRFETPEQAQKNIELTQARARGLIDPDYVSQQRALIRLDETGRTVGALVPAGMDAHIGQRITFISGHRSKLPCHYIPNLIINPLVS